MTDATIVTIAAAAIAAIAPTMVAWASLQQGRLNGKKTDHNVTATAALSQKVDDKSEMLGIKSDEIHSLTNGNLTAVKHDLVVALREVTELRKLIVSMVGKDHQTPERTDT